MGGVCCTMTLEPPPRSQMNVDRSTKSFSESETPAPALEQPHDANNDKSVDSESEVEMSSSEALDSESPRQDLLDLLPEGSPHPKLSLDFSMEELEDDEKEEDSDEVRNNFLFVEGKEEIGTMHSELERFELLLDSRKSLKADTVAYRQLMASLHPSLKHAWLEVQFVTLSLATGSSMAAAKSPKSPLSGRRLSGRRRSSKRRRSGHSLSGLSLKRTGVYIKADYVNRMRQIDRVTKKYSSREYDSDIVDVRETVSFPLTVKDVDCVDEDESDASGVHTPHSDASDAAEGCHLHGDEHVDGHICIRVKQSSGALSKAQRLGFAEIHIEDKISTRAIPRGGGWAEIVLPLYEMSSEEFSSSQKRASHKRRKSLLGKKKMSTPTKTERQWVGELQARCRLHWESEAMAAFYERPSVTVPSTDETLLLHDKHALMRTRTAQLKVTILAVAFDTEAVVELRQSKSIPELTRSLSGLHVQSDARSCMALKNMFAECCYLCGESVVRKRTAKHSSKVKEILFVNESLEFLVKPFMTDKTVGKGTSTQERLHKLWFSAEAKAKEVPGYMSIEFQRGIERREEAVDYGCSVLSIAEMFANAPFGHDSLKSEPSLCRAQLLKVRKRRRNVVGEMFYSYQFDWNPSAT